MKVAVVHNDYRSTAPSGENAAVRSEIGLLRDAGVDVVELIRTSDDIAGMSALRKLETAMGPTYNRSGVREFTSALRQHRPDLVHVHNVYPLWSPAVVSSAHAEGIPVVHTVHNYRQTCVNGLHFRNGQPCDDCLGRRLPWPAVVHSCYRSSVPQSVSMALGQAVHPHTWRAIDAFLVLTSFMARRIASLGIPDERIVLRPNAVADPGEPQTLGTDFLFIGRLDESKGADLLVSAWRLARLGPPWTLRVVGGGPILPHLTRLAAGDPSICIQGPADAGTVSSLLRRARAVVIPSTWYEGLPLVLVEALAHGRPVFTSRVGSLAAATPPDAGLDFEPTVSGVAGALSSAAASDRWAEWSENARRHYLSEHRLDTSTRRLLNVYEQLVQR